MRHLHFGRADLQAPTPAPTGNASLLPGTCRGQQSRCRRAAALQCHHRPPLHPHTGPLAGYSSSRSRAAPHRLEQRVRACVSIGGEGCKDGGRRGVDVPSRASEEVDMHWHTPLKTNGNAMCITHAPHVHPMHQMWSYPGRPVGLRRTRRLAFVKGSLVIGSMYSWGPPSGTRVSLMGVRSFIFSFFPLAGHSVSIVGLSTRILGSGVRPGIQNARTSCAGKGTGRQLRLIFQLVHLFSRGEIARSKATHTPANVHFHTTHSSSHPLPPSSDQLFLSRPQIHKPSSSPRSPVC
jgi:hypothetical protein